MDLANVRKYIDSESDKNKIIRAVTEVKNAVKNNEQVRDIVMSDHFKTLREPLIEQQKQSDEKQDKVIQQLKENQLALTSGFKDLVETNKDILTLNKELPFAGEQPTGTQPAIPAPPLGEVITAQPNNMFTESELEFLKKSFHEPNDLLKMSEEQLVTAYNEAKDENRSVGIKIGGLKRRKPKTEDEKQQLDYDLKTYERTRDIIDRYLTTIKNVKILPQYTKKGEGVRKYKQPKQNAYKITAGNQYGGLFIDIPKLMKNQKLDVYHGGKIIYQANADKSPIDLLTKRYNPKTKYSMNAVKIFNDLNMLGNLPPHKSSGKSRLIRTGSGMFYYNNPSQLVDRVRVLRGSITAGNNNPVLKNDLSQIIDELLRIGEIDKSAHEGFYKKYLE